MDLGTAVGAIQLVYQGGGAVQQATADLQGLEKQGLAAGAAQAAMGAGLAAGGKQVLDFLGDSVGKAANVQETLLAVQAATGATTDEVQILDKTIGQLGSDTVFSTQEVADASLVMARAGIDASEQAGGALKTVTDLAAATGESLEASANLTSNTMSIFGLGTDEITKTADLHTQAMNSSRVGLAEYEAGVRNLGPVLAGYAQTQEEVDQALLDTAASTAFLTAAGLKGADAGLSTARMIENIATPATDDYKAALDEAGLSVFDLEGNFKGLPAIIADVNKAMEGLTDQQKAEKLDEWGIGQEALDVLNTFANQGDKYDQFVEDMLAGNDAAESAEIMMQGLNGALEGLGGTFEEIQRQIGNDFLAPLESIVRAIDEVASKFLELDPAVQTAIASIAGVAGVVMTVVGAFVAAAGAIAGFNAIMGAAGVGALSAGAILGATVLIIAALAAAVLAYQTNFLGFRDAVDGAVKGIKKFGSEFGNAFSTNKAAGLNDVAAAIGAIGVALDNTLGTDFFPFFQDLAQAVQSFGDTFKVMQEQGFGMLPSLLTAASAAAQELGLGELAYQLESASIAAEQMGNSFRDAFAANKAEGMSGAAAAIDAIGQALSDVLGFDVSGPFEALANAVDGALNPLSDFRIKLGEIKDALGELLGAQLTNLMETLGGIGRGLADAFGSLMNGDLAGAFTGLGDAVGSALRGSLDMLGNFGGFVRDALASINWGEVASAVGTALTSALNSAGDFITGLDPSAILQSVSDTLLNAFQGAADFLGPIAATIGSALTTAINGIGEFLGGLNFSQIATDVGNKISEAFTNIGTAFDGIKTTIGNALATALSGIGDFLGQLNFGDLVGKVTEAIVAAFGGGYAGEGGPRDAGASGGLSSIAESIGNALGEALQSIGDFVGDINLSETVSGIVSKIESAFNEGGTFDLSAMGENLKTALEDAAGIDLTGAFDKLGEAASKVGGAMTIASAAISGAISAIKATFEGIDFAAVFDGLTDAAAEAGRAMSTAQTAVSGAFSAIKATIDGIDFSGVSEAIDGVATALGNIKDAVPETVGTNLQAMVDALTGLNIPDLGSVLNGIAGAITAVGSAASGAVQAVKDFFGALGTTGNPDDPMSEGNLEAAGQLQGLALLMDSVGGSDQAEQALGMGGDFATNFINNIASSFASADYSPIVNAMNAGLASVLSGGGQAELAGSGDIAGAGGTSIGTTFVQGLIADMVAAFTPEAFAPIQTAFNTALTTLGTSIDTSVSSIQTSLQAIIPAIQSIAAGAAVAIGGMNTTITSAFQTLQTSVDTAVTGIQTSVQAIIPAIQQIAVGVGTAIGSMATTVQSAFASLQASVDTAISGIQTSIQAIIPAIQSIATEVGTAIQSMTTTITTAFSQMQGEVDAAVSGIQTSVQAIIPALNSVAAEAGTAAGSIGDAIVAALDADLEAVRSSAAALGAAATVPIQSAIQPGSPSKVVMPWAESIPEALVEGMESGIDEVTDTSAALGEAATEGMVEATEAGIQTAQDLMDRTLVIFEDGSSKWMTEAEKAEWFGTALEESATPAVEEGMTNTMTSAADAAAAGLEKARELFSQYGLTFGNELAEKTATGVAEGAEGAAQQAMSLYDQIVQRVQERLGGLWKGGGASQTPDWMAQAENLMRQRNPWAADLMRDQEMTFNFEATLDGQKMSDWTVRETLGGMLGVRDRGGMKRGMKV